MCGTHRSLTLTTLAALGLLAGCSAEQPHFHKRDGTDDLVPVAQAYVREQLGSKFGSPTQSVAWEQLPLHFHAATATVVGDPGQREFAVDIDEQSLPVQPGDEVLWLSGELVQKPAGVIASYDKDTRTVQLERDLPEAPAVGDHVALGPGKVLQNGRMLFAEHCQHCHGVTGDGAGPTAKYLNPRPRDYRLGVFKFTSTSSTRRAQRGDLARTIENGIPGTYMPSFKLLKPDESTAIVEYVLWLSMRGETEYKLMDPEKGLLSADWTSEAVAEELPDEIEDTKKQLEQYEADLPTYQARLEELEKQLSSAPAADQNKIEAQIDYVKGAIEIIENNIRITQDDLEDPSRITRRKFADQFDNLVTDTDDLIFNPIISDWTVSQNEDSVVIPSIPRTGSDAASIARGRAIFMDPNAKCYTCHGEAALGNGEQTLAVQQGHTEPGLFDVWGNPIQPRNLTTGIYRGGRRPIDIYRRIYAGIKGTPMAGFSASLSDEKIWDLVNYVLSVPFEEREPGEGGFVPGEGSAQPPQVAASEATSSATDH